MTLREAIASVDTLKPNQYSTAQKVSWLNQCDSAIHSNIVMTHELPAGNNGTFKLYSETELDRELIAPAPYDILYRHYLESRIDLYNKENANYNNTNLLYTAAYNAFAGWYTQNHMPRSKATHFKL
jgi:hypothetical protein